MKDFSISLQTLLHGWATIKFKSCERELVYNVSHISSDALSCLVCSALNIIQNKPYQTKFYLEPDYLAYEVNPHNGEVCILIGDTGFSCDRKRYAKQILKIFDGYIFLHSIEEYSTQWYCDYPQNAIEQLRDQLRKDI